MWKSYKASRPEVGVRFIYAHNDRCTTGMALMTEDGPLDAEDMTNLDNICTGLDWWVGAIWTPLPDGYKLSFELGD